MRENSVCAIFAHTASDGKIYKTQFYNLDAIISVGYKVNSKQATQFRIWATKTLKDHLLKGYTINEKRLSEAKEKFNELQTAISFLQEKSKKELLAGQEGEILNLLSNYAKTLTILEQYDKGELKELKGGKTKFVLEYVNCLKIIAELKRVDCEKKKRWICLEERGTEVLRELFAGFTRHSEGKNYILLLRARPRIFFISQ